MPPQIPPPTGVDRIGRRAIRQTVRQADRVATDSLRRVPRWSVVHRVKTGLRRTACLIANTNRAGLPKNTPQICKHCAMVNRDSPPSAVSPFQVKRWGNRSFGCTTVIANYRQQCAQIARYIDTLCRFMHSRAFLGLFSQSAPSAPFAAVNQRSERRSRPSARGSGRWRSDRGRRLRLTRCGPQR